MDNIFLTNEQIGKEMAHQLLRSARNDEVFVRVCVVERVLHTTPFFLAIRYRQTTEILSVQQQCKKATKSIIADANDPPQNEHRDNLTTIMT